MVGFDLRYWSDIVTLILKLIRLASLPTLVVGAKNSDGLPLGIACHDSLSFAKIAEICWIISWILRACVHGVMMSGVVEGTKHSFAQKVVHAMPQIISLSLIN